MEGIRAGRRGSQRHVRTRGLGNQEGHQFYWVEKQRVPQFREICSGKKKKKKPNPTRFEKYVQIPRTRFRKRSQGTRNRGAEGRPDLGIRRKSTAPSVQETAQNVTSAEKAGEGTHHSLSPSPRETPAGPPAPALRAPRLRTCAPHPAPRRSRHGRDLPPCPPNTLPLAPESRHCHCPCHPSCAAASVRTGRLPPQQAWPQLAAQGRAAGSPRLPASAPANTPARCSRFTVSRAPPPPAGLPLAFPHPSV